MNIDDVNVEYVFDSDKFEDLQCAHGSSSDGQSWPKFNIEFDMVNSKIEKGLIFPKKDSVKDVFKQYGRVNRYFIKFPTNYFSRLKVVCKDQCNWSLWPSKLNPNDLDDSTWKVKTFNPQHTCSKVFKNKNITTEWVVEHYKEKFITNPHYALTSVQKDAIRGFHSIISLTEFLVIRDS